jgi:iron complex transport system ATP-binding protein
MILHARSVTVPGRLHDVSASVRAGDVTAILGRNGAGKSTLLAALAGLVPGNVSLDDAPLARMAPALRARHIGYLPQGGEVAWNLSVENLAALGRLPHRTGAAEDARVVAETLAALDLTPLAQREVLSLSGGERARALLARVLATQPDWILADEPLASLDLAQAHAMLARFRALATQGKGVALVLHDLAQAMNHADRVIVVDEGRVVAQGQPEHVLTEALIAQVWGVKARWLGEPGARALAAG